MNGKFCGESLPKRGPVAGCKPVCQGAAVLFAWELPREEMRGRVVPPLSGKTSARLCAAKLGGTTEAIRLSSQVIGRKRAFFVPKTDPIKEEPYEEKLTQLLQEGRRRSAPPAAKASCRRSGGPALGKQGAPDGPSEGAAPAGRESAAGDGQGREPGQGPSGRSC